MKKKIIAMLLVLTMAVCAFPMSAFADNSEKNFFADTSNVNLQCIVSKPTPMNSFCITRGTSLPTEKYVFDGTTPYKGSFSDVSAGIYTNYYFTGYTKYNVSFTNVSATANCNLIFYLYNMTTGTMVGTAKKVAISSSSSDNEAYASYDAIANSKYCVFFRTDRNASISGNIKVSYSY